MTYPNCDEEMLYDEETGAYYCPECGYVDDCHN